ncbi:hypothetical protein ACHAO9_002098 [Fusarium lateritium]
MAPFPGLYPRQAVPVPPPANPYNRPGQAHNAAQRPTPYSGGRVDKKGGVWRSFLNWFNDPGLGQDRTAVVVSVIIISLFIIGILAYLFITKKKKLDLARGNLEGVRDALKESREEHSQKELDKALHQDPPTKEEDEERAKIEAKAAEQVAVANQETARLQAELEASRSQNAFQHMMNNMRR